MTIHLILGLIKKTLYKMSQYFPQQFKSIGGNINVKLNLSNYATKSDLKNIAHVDIVLYSDKFCTKSKFS